MMSRHWRALRGAFVALLAASLAAASPAVASQQSTERKQKPRPFVLTVTSTGIPAGTAIALRLQGPATQTITKSGKAVVRLPKPGRYTWVADPVFVNAVAFNPTPVSGTFVARAGGAGSVALSFASTDAPPAAPTQVAVTPNYQEATVTWQPPSTEGISAITGYSITATPVGGAGQPRTVTADAGNPGRFTMGGFSETASYTFSVIATNVAGSSSPSESTAPVALGPNYLDFCTSYLTPNGILIQNRSLSVISSATPTNPSWGRTFTNTTNEIQYFKTFWLEYPGGRQTRLSTSQSDYLKPGETRRTGQLLPSITFGNPPWGIASVLAYGGDWYFFPGGADPFWRLPPVGVGDRFDCP